MSDEAREIHPYMAVAPDRQAPIKDFRPRFEEPAFEVRDGDEEYGGLTVEEVKSGDEGDEDPKGGTVTVSASSSKPTAASPTPPAPKTTEKSAGADTEGSASRQGNA
ncbi:hypothetical protein AB0F25_30600 [Streptomyces wedmorensis]|uniref:hypothetical protein n=1 Tax=Streptomyces wedmorensis TaxID=43759 RepID=UPI0034343346